MKSMSEQEPRKREQKDLEEEKIGFVFAYVFPIFTGVLVYLLYAKKNKELKFHAVQATLYGLVLLVAARILSLIFNLLSWVSPLLSWISVLGFLAVLVAWAYGVYVGFEAYNGRRISLPLIGDLAKKA